MVRYVVCHWNSGIGIGIQLLWTYELVQLECGLEGNFLQHQYGTYEVLATNTWMKTLWNYTDYYNIKLELDDVVTPLPWERDKVIMELIVHTAP